jgi:hypothetical protein
VELRDALEFGRLPRNSFPSSFFIGYTKDMLRNNISI